MRKLLEAATESVENCRTKSDACMQISHETLHSASLKSSMAACRHICIGLQAIKSNETCEASHIFDWARVGKAICKSETEARRKSERDEHQTHSNQSK